MRRGEPQVPKDLARLPREELAKLVTDLVRHQRVLRAQIRSLKRKLKEARAKKGHAPFSKGPKKGERKKPGRKKGQKPFRSRPGFPVESVTDWVSFEDPKVCPHCGSADIEIDEEREYFSTTDLPDKPSVKVMAGYRPKGHCRRCNKRWRVTHPDVPDDQYGATAHRLGPRPRAEAHRLHYCVRVPVRRVPAVLEVHGIKVTQSALTQDALRSAERGAVAERARQIKESIPQASNVHTDATGWRINGASAALMTFATPDDAKGPGVTAYSIEPHHGAAEVIEVIGKKFAGTLNVDRGVEYRANVLKGTKFQRCMGHLTHNVKKVLAIKVGAARDFGEKMLALKDEALQLHADWHAGRRDGYNEKVGRIEARFTDHLRDRRLTDPDNQRLLNGIGAEQDKGNLLRFLHDPRISPFNYLAERELRPPVVARKISHCSKSERGANAQAKLSTVFRTEERAQRFKEKTIIKREQEQQGKKQASPITPASPARPAAAAQRPSIATRILDTLTPLFRRRTRPPPSRTTTTGPPQKKPR
jgi:transposase